MCLLASNIVQEPHFICKIQPYTYKREILSMDQ